MVNHGIASKFIGQARKESQVAKRPIVSKFLGRKEQNSLERIQTPEALMAPSEMEMSMEMQMSMQMDIDAQMNASMDIDAQLGMPLDSISTNEQIATPEAYEPFVATATQLEDEQTTTQQNLIALLAEVYEEPKKAEPSLEDLLNIGNDFHQ